MAIGVALSPVPIIGLILMLLSERARSNGLAFLLGWVVGLSAAGAIILALSSGADAQADDGTTESWVGWVKIALGLLLAFLAVHNWQSRPAAGEKGEMPAWMTSVSQFNAPKAAGMGLVLSAVNPKNLALTAAAATSIAAADLSTAESVAVLAIFVVIASLTIAIPVLTYFVMGEKAAVTLGAWREWLERNNNTVMAVIFVIFAAKLLGDGISVVTA
jgi:threonine/homoserine/homoserine lactone efflux protein